MLGDVLWSENKARFKLGSLWGKGRKEGTVTGMTNFRTLLCERLTNAKLAHLPPFLWGYLALAGPCLASYAAGSSASHPLRS